MRTTIASAAIVLLLGACGGEGSPPPRDSAVLSEVPFPTTGLYSVDALDGRAYALGYDDMVYEISEPPRAVVDASAFDVSITGFRMESADTAWFQVSGADGDELHRLGPSGETVITPADLATASGLDGYLVGFDVASDGTLWIVVFSGVDENAVCVRPAGGSLSCTTSAAILGGRVIPVGNGAILWDYDVLQFFADGVVTDLPIPGGAYALQSVSALGASRVHVVAMDMNTQQIGMYAVETTGAATEIVEPTGELLGQPGIDVFVRGENDIWYSTVRSEWISECNPPCTDGHYAWLQYVVWHSDGTTVRELGHVNLQGAAALVVDVPARRVLPLDESAYLLTVSGLAWRGTR